VILGFAPYVTNVLNGRHIFHPLFQRGVEKSPVNGGLEKIAQNVYPTCHNRFTRFLFSVMAYPSYSENYPAELKNPLGAPWLEWQMYKNIEVARAGGMGPLFFLLCLLALAYLFISRGRVKPWLPITLAALVAIQPHSWQARYVPFIGLFPAALLTAAYPGKGNGKEYLLPLPLLLSIINVLGIGYVRVGSALELNRQIIERLSPHEGEYVLLNKSVFQCDGFFDRFAIKQKFANLEATFFPNSMWNNRPENIIGRPLFGGDIAFEEDIPPLPASPVFFGEESAGPWMKMSEGVVFYDPEEEKTFSSPFIASVPKGVWNYAEKVKFFMKVTENPSGDMLFSLTASSRAGREGQKMRALVFANFAGYPDFRSHPIGEWVWNRPGADEKTIVIPWRILTESRQDPMKLLILMFYLSSGEESNFTPARPFQLMFEKMEFRHLGGVFP
jgi:hypothetical protein